MFVFLNYIRNPTNPLAWSIPQVRRRSNSNDGAAIFSPTRWNAVRRIAFHVAQTRRLCSGFAWFLIADRLVLLPRHSKGVKMDLPKETNENRDYELLRSLRKNLIAFVRRRRAWFGRVFVGDVEIWSANGVGVLRYVEKKTFTRQISDVQTIYRRT